MSRSVAMLAACLALCCAEAPVDHRAVAAPYPASGWKPSGQLLLLPLRQQEAAQHYQQPYNQYGPPEQISANENPNTSTQAGESDNDSSFPASQQLQQQPGVTSGVYHVLLPDGRLQRVEFTTAPLNSEAAQSFTSPSQHQNKQENNNLNQQNQPDPRDHTRSFQIQQSQNFEVAPVQQLAFPGAFPQRNEQVQSAKFTQGQSVGQSAFQKPTFQQNQFGLNTFQQSQSQQNQFGLNSFQQKPVGGKYQQGQGQNSQQEDSFSASGLLQQQKQYLIPESTISESQNSFNQHNTFQQTQINADIPSGRIVNAQLQQSGQTDTETVPPTNTGSGFVANVQYKDVEPIPGPIYSYNPAPLVRILRKTE
ncbi:hypothetical protein LSTR_LSTR004724 [Laodelphax striatellus]|uniref:DUF4794 domain-containing protein n=1 Tax=Laodelphax striatellus TaxID=195883 RepID=A0A482WUQ8_LAOST|nr:hypothetical protein LSTR_LSTR004724 [Laodelphax striatellus]